MPNSDEPLTGPSSCPRDLRVRGPRDRSPAAYLAELDGLRDHILHRFGIDAYKAAARTVMGRDEAQTEALKRTSAYLHRIEVITFDGLLRIARRVLSQLGGQDSQSIAAR